MHFPPLPTCLSRLQCPYIFSSGQSKALLHFLTLIIVPSNHSNEKCIGERNMTASRPAAVGDMQLLLTCVCSANCKLVQGCHVWALTRVHMHLLIMIAWLVLHLDHRRRPDEKSAVYCRPIIYMMTLTTFYVRHLKVVQGQAFQGRIIRKAIRHFVQASSLKVPKML